MCLLFFFQAEDGIRDLTVTGVQTCALPICLRLEALASLWPWVLLVAGLRVVAMRYGVVWAGQDPGVRPVLARDGWLGLISQGGVAVGLAAVARRGVPAGGGSLRSLSLGVSW